MGRVHAAGSPRGERCALPGIILLNAEDPQSWILLSAMQNIVVPWSGTCK